MRSFIFGVVVGVVVSTTGISGIAKILDNGLAQVKNYSQELSK